VLVQIAREVLEKRSFKPAVDADWQKSREYGVTGAQPYQVLEQLVTETTRP
jgi:predicted DsbA family dithiol-disulfide isomerase